VADRTAAARAALREQAQWGDRLNSPLTGLLCRLLADRLDESTEVGRAVLGWQGDPAPDKDNVPARLCAGLHFLARIGRAPELARLYPPARLPDAETLWAALAPVLAGQSDALLPWLDHPPQTNEVARSAVLMAGMLVIAEGFGLPLRLFEFGSSAGLNLILDRYAYDLGGIETGDLGSPLRLRPEWHGAPPPSAKVEVASRRGVDLHPIDVRADGERLLAYVWPGHEDRRRRLEQALAIAVIDPPLVEQGDAADWLAQLLPKAAGPGAVRTIFHSVAYQYFPSAVQNRIARLIEQLGAASTPQAPLAWLRYEQQPGEPGQSLRLRTWPGEEVHLAWAHAHGARVEWLIGSGPARR
jgi:hypothetical protein